MKKLSRIEAENLIQPSQIVSTDIEQQDDAMQIFMTLKDDRIFMMDYNLTDHIKTYYFLESGLRTI